MFGCIYTTGCSVFRFLQYVHTLGIGFATTLIVFFLNVYYNVIMSWAFFYFFASFTDRVPWSHCDNDYNTPFCRYSGTASLLYLSYQSEQRIWGTLVLVCSVVCLTKTRSVVQIFPYSKLRLRCLIELKILSTKVYTGSL